LRLDSPKPKAHPLKLSLFLLEFLKYDILLHVAMDVNNIDWPVPVVTYILGPKAWTKSSKKQLMPIKHSLFIN
jgi:hypothetical protein